MRQGKKLPLEKALPPCPKCGGVQQLSKKTYGFMSLRGIFCPHCQLHLVGK